MGACDVSDSAARKVCWFLEDGRAAALAAVPVHVGITRTDFRDPKHPKPCFVRSNDSCIDKRPDGTFVEPVGGQEPELEYLQAAVRLGEIAAGVGRGNAASQPSSRPAIATASRDVLLLLKVIALRVDWLPTDPTQYPDAASPKAEKLAQAYVRKADAIWRRTARIKNVDERRRAYAKALFKAMSRPASEGGFGITFFDPNVTKIDKRDHPFYSRKLDCIGAWLYGALCSRRGIRATPVQVFTDGKGKSIDHVIVGVALNPKKTEQLTLVNFQPGEQGFDIRLPETRPWAPISRLELMAYYHLTKAYTLYPNDRAKQWEELERARRCAPHNYLVHYQLGVWYWKGGMRQEAKDFFRRSAALNPTHHPSRAALAD